MNQILKSLNEVVKRAVAAQNRPLQPGEEVPWLPHVAYLEETGSMKPVYAVVDRLLDDSPELYNRFLHESALVDAIVTQAEEWVEPPEWEPFCEQLGESARETWLFAVPVANLLSPRSYVQLAERVGLAPADQERLWRRGSPDPEDMRAMFAHLGDRISIRPRWSPEKFGPVDTRRTGAFLIVEDGVAGMARERAFTRASLAIASWCLLRPPEWDELWPAVGEWAPAPSIHYETEYKRYDDRVWTGPRRHPTRGGRVSEYGPYVLPDDERLLRAPFAALERVGGHHCARALLTAAWLLHVASRQSDRLLRTDRLQYTGAAIEALGDPGRALALPGFPDPPPRSQDDDAARDRWERVADKYGAWSELGKHYPERRLKEARRAARDLRNIGSHGGDSSLANLGYPAGSRRRLPKRGVVDASELSVARAAAAIPIMLAALHAVTRQLWEGALDNGWDDDWYERQFS